MSEPTEQERITELLTQLDQKLDKIMELLQSPEWQTTVEYYIHGEQEPPPEEIDDVERTAPWTLVN